MSMLYFFSFVSMILLLYHTHITKARSHKTPHFSRMIFVFVSFFVLEALYVYRIIRSARMPSVRIDAP
jgi:hypothetical protein